MLARLFAFKDWITNSLTAWRRLLDAVAAATYYYAVTDLEQAVKMQPGQPRPIREYRASATQPGNNSGMPVIRPEPEREATHLMIIQKRC
jgi:hypothetical protein